MRATVLADNIGSQGLAGEWGLSFYIQYEGQKILLDTGASSLFARNAAKLGLSLAEIDCAVLSHAHYDHANGLKTFFQINSLAKLYVGPGCGEDCYSKKLLGFKEYIGPRKGVLKAYGDRIVFTDGPSAIGQGVRLLPHSGPIHPYVGARDNLYVLRDGRLQPDDFSHEQSLVFELPEGIAIFNSCCHGGADRIIREAQEAYPGRAVLAMIGGFHLFQRTDAEVAAMAQRLRETGVKKIYTGHCTGDQAYKVLRWELGDMVQQLRVGMEILL
ncbi:MAG: MBL fold metallo-hydrolase [Oscillospiraceae bacterium]|nr:MBL fold metallo-hydrolase [Oscillospiraceae bacterium]